MAYFNQNNDQNTSLGMNQKKEEEKDAPVNGAAPAPAAPITLSSASANGANNTPATTSTNPNPVSANKSASSGMGGGFQSYQKANQGVATSRLTDAAKNNIASQGQAAQKGITQATDQFGQKVEAGTLANRENALTDVGNTLNSVKSYTVQQGPVAPTAPKFGSNPIINQQAGQIYNQQLKQFNQQKADYDNAQKSLAPTEIKGIAGTDRFKEVINAKYQGPESLRQAGLYQVASGKVDQAANTAKNAATAAGREEMLRDMYAKRGDYTKGLNKLDSATLNSSQSGVSAIQDAAKAQGNVKGDLAKAQINSNNIAQNRTQEINDIRNQARKTFETGLESERAKVDARLSAVVKDWDKLPEHYRNIIRNKQSNNVQFTDQEAAMLGLRSGEGLYNAGADVIKTASHDERKLISKDEQSRQAALAKLAGLDLTGTLDTKIGRKDQFKDASIAGTQTALDALDKINTRKALDAQEKSFQDFAKTATVSGSGMKKDKSDGKKYYANIDQNLSKVLSGAGYGIDKSGGAQKGVAGVVNGAISPLSGGGSVASTIGNLVGMGGLNYVTGALGMGGLGDAVSKVFGSGGDAKRSQGIANDIASKDFQKNLESTLNSQGFNNRTTVGNAGLDQNRLNALNNLIANLNKNNYKG